MTLTIEGDEVFSVNPSSVAAAQANATNEITVTYSPQSIGTHSATLKISSEGAETLQIQLYGTCSKECHLLWTVNGSEYTGEAEKVVAVGGRPVVIPTDIQSCSAESEMFAGWTAMPIAGKQQQAPADLFSDTEDAPEVETDTRFYAVFAHLSKVEGSAEQTASVDFSKVYSNTQDVTSVSVGAVNISFDKASSQNAAKYYTKGNGVRTYSGSQISFSGSNIKKIGFGFGSEDHTNPITVNTGSFNTDTWTGNSDNVVFTIGGSSKFRCISTITVIMQDIIEQYTYSDFITSCGVTTGVDETKAEKPVQTEKRIIGDRLFIKVGDSWYDIMGQKSRQ